MNFWLSDYISAADRLCLMCVSDFLTWDPQQQQVERGGSQAAHSLLDIGRLRFRRQNKGGEHSHEGLDWNLVLPQRGPDTLK